MNKSLQSPKKQVYKTKAWDCYFSLIPRARPSHCLSIKDKQRRKPTPILYAVCVPALQKHRKHNYTTYMGIYRCLVS